MNPYTCCWVSTCFFAHMAGKAKRKSMIFFYSFITIMIPSLLGGLRSPGVGIDVGGYVMSSYNLSMRISRLSEYIFQGGKVYHEIGWATLTYFITKIFESLNWNLFIYQLIVNTFMYIGAWKHRKTIPMPMTLIMYFLTHYNHTYNLVRNSIACSIIFMGLDTIEKRQYGKFSIYIAVATCFHSSTLICVVYILALHFAITSKSILGLKKNLKMTLIYSALGLLAIAKMVISRLVSLIPLLSKYEGYAESTVSGWNGVGYAEAFLVVGELIIFLFYSKGAKRFFIEKWEGGKGMFEYCRYLVVFIIVYRFGLHFFPRAIIYLEYINILILASLPNFVKRKSSKAIILVAVIAAGFIQWWYVFIKKGMVTSGTWPYVSIL